MTKENKKKIFGLLSEVTGHTAELLAATVGFLNANTEKRVQQLNGEEPHS